MQTHVRVDKNDSLETVAPRLLLSSLEDTLFASHEKQVMHFPGFIILSEFVENIPQYNITLSKKFTMNILHIIQI